MSEQVPVQPEALAWALQCSKGHDLRARTKVVLFYQAAYGKLDIKILAALSELSRNEVRIALNELAHLGWINDEGELQLPQRFVNRPHPVKPNDRN